MKNLPFSTLALGDSKYDTVKIGDHYFAKISVSDFTKTPPAPIQRNSHLRVNKMKPIFNGAYAAKQSSTLTEVAIGVVVEDFVDVDPGTQTVLGSYKAGETYIVDGNTRKHYWMSEPERAAELDGLTAKIHLLRNMDDVRYAYYPYNSKDSVEKPGEILQGLARRYNWTPNQKIFANGGYKSALDIATMVPGTTKPMPIFEGFNYFFEELKLLDSLPKGGTNNITRPAYGPIKSQLIIAALLVALKMYPNNLRLYEFINALCHFTEEDAKLALTKKEVSPVEIIALEYSGLSAVRCQNATPWLGGMAGSTKFATYEPQMDFLLHWIEVAISSPSATYKLVQGVKPNHWANAWGTAYCGNTEEDTIGVL